MGLPARGYSWSPFAPGHKVSEKHGAFVPSEIEAMADELVGQVVEHAPWVAGASFAPGVRRYARAEAIAARLFAYVAEHGPLDEEGNPRPALTALDRWEASAAARGAQLGLDPTSMAKLLGSISSAAGNENAAEVLAALRAEGRRLVDARAADTAPAVGESGGMA